MTKRVLWAEQHTASPRTRNQRGIWNDRWSRGESIISAKDNANGYEMCLDSMQSLAATYGAPDFVFADDLVAFFRGTDGRTDYRVQYTFVC